MAIEVHDHPTDQSVTSLVGDILKDAQDLIKQQFQLARQEVAMDLRKTRQAVANFAVGGGLCLLSALMLSLMLALLLNWLGAPPGYDPSHLPLWVAFLIVGCLLALGGVVAIWAGKKHLDAMGTPLHETAQALRENLEWQNNRR